MSENPMHKTLTLGLYVHIIYKNT